MRRSAAAAAASGCPDVVDQGQQEHQGVLGVNSQIPHLAQQVISPGAIPVGEVVHGAIPQEKPQGPGAHAVPWFRTELLGQAKLLVQVLGCPGSSPPDDRKGRQKQGFGIIQLPGEGQGSGPQGPGIGRPAIMVCHLREQEVGDDTVGCPGLGVPVGPFRPPPSSGGCRTRDGAVIVQAPQGYPARSPGLPPVSRRLGQGQRLLRRLLHSP